MESTDPHDSSFSRFLFCLFSFKYFLVYSHLNKFWKTKKCNPENQERRWPQKVKGRKVTLQVGLWEIIEVEGIKGEKYTLRKEKVEQRGCAHVFRGGFRALLSIYSSMVMRQGLAGQPRILGLIQPMSSHWAHTGDRNKLLTCICFIFYWNSVACITINNGFSLTYSNTHYQSTKLSAKDPNTPQQPPISWQLY